MSASERSELRLARRLASASTHIEIGAGQACFLVGGDRRGPIDGETVTALLARGALEAEAPGRYRLSAAGRAMVRRQLASGDDFAAQHQQRERQVIDEPGDRHSVTVHLGESPLGWLRAHKGRDGRPMIDAVSFEAGERLRADFTRGQLMPSITTNWSSVLTGGGRGGGRGGIAELTEAALAARLRVERALAALGPELSGTLVDFCCFLKGVEEIERDRGWPKRSAKLVLQLGLSALARHYGLTPTERRGEAARSE